MSRVVYALEDPYGGAMHLDPTQIVRHAAEVPIVERGCCRQSAIGLFRRFFTSTEDQFWSSHPENALRRVVES